MNRIKAQDRLHVDGLPAVRDAQDLDKIYNLVMVAYDDEEMAIEARDRAAKAWVEAETRKER